MLSMIWLPNRVHRAERGHRLLEDHADLGAADRANPGAARVEARQVRLLLLPADVLPVFAAVQQDLTIDDVSGW